MGQTSQALLTLAIADLNSFLSSAGVSARVQLRVEDTKLDPTICMNSARVLAGAGINLVIGPQSSTECAAILPSLNSLGLICISQGSTAATLSLPNDNLFRWVPDDPIEAEAVVALALHTGIKTLVPAWRGDPGNRGLALSVRQQFTAAGGTVTEGMEYPVDSANFTAVANKLAADLKTAGPGKAAIYLAAFDEVVDLFHATTLAPALASVPWIGSDGVALSAPLIGDPVAADFAVKTGYASPTLLRPDGAREKWQPLVDIVKPMVGIEPDAFALAAYDAFMAAMLARLLAGTSDVAAWKRYLPFVAENFFGNTGWGRLNANGDRAFGDYEFWALRNVDGAPQWTSVARFEDDLVTLS